MNLPFVKRLAAGATLSVVAGCFSTYNHVPDFILSSAQAHTRAVDKVNSDAYKVVRMKVTGYCPCKKCCGPNAKGISASGYRIRKGKLAAAPKHIPLHTRVYVPGYSYTHVPVLDRGGAITGNRLDVFFSTHKEALKWGVKILDVKVYK